MHNPPLNTHTHLPKKVISVDDYIITIISSLENGSRSVMIWQHRELDILFKDYLLKMAQLPAFSFLLPILLTDPRISAHTDTRPTMFSLKTTTLQMFLLYWIAFQSSTLSHKNHLRCKVNKYSVRYRLNIIRSTLTQGEKTTTLSPFICKHFQF